MSSKSGIYDEIKRLYEALSIDDITVAKHIIKTLIKHGVDKTFISKMLRTIAIEKMMEALYDEIKQNAKHQTITMRNKDET